MKVYCKIIKPITDKILALIILVFFSPLILILSLLIYLEQKEFPFFFQQRLGKDCKIFEIWKFKKMLILYDEKGKLLPEDQRLTKVGKFIRKASLDEIPQFFNILKGDMSFIGPRPLLAKYLPYYTPLECLRHSVKPGLTGWAQVNGRIALEWDSRFEFDLEYVKKQNLWFDFKILILTVKTVIVSFFKPVHNPLNVLPRFFQYRRFVRLPLQNEDFNNIENFIRKNSKKQLTLNLKKIISDSANRKIDLNYFLLLDDKNGNYNSFAIFKKQNSKAELLSLYVDEQIWNWTEMKNHYIELGNLYALHFEKIKSWSKD